MSTTKTKSETVRREQREAEGISYDYTLSVKRSERTASFRLPLYSVGVRIVDERGVESSAMLEDVFLSSESAFAFFDRIVENLATPIDLPFVFEDEMGR